MQLLTGSHCRRDPLKTARAVVPMRRLLQWLRPWESAPLLVVQALPLLAPRRRVALPFLRGQARGSWTMHLAEPWQQPICELARMPLSRA